LSGEPLPGIGSDVWRRLYLAAREYSEEKAYPDVPFPNVADGSVCVLCQQPLDLEARDRLSRFSAFVNSKTETRMAEVEVGIGQELEVLARQSFDSSGGDAATLEELAELDAALASDVQTHAKESQARAAALAAAAQDGSWDSLPSEPRSPAARLEALARRLAGELAALEAAAEPTETAALEKELAEVDARAALLRHRDNLIARLRLEECLKEVKTTGISRKQSELADAAVTDVLREALQREVTDLGFTKLAFAIATRTRDGQSYSQLELSEPMGRRVQLSAVLSEGEQTVVAIASFLAELRAGSHTCGVVFDDPVCSLDHLWRDRIAKRLAEEGCNRQVIVFTHDVAFVLALHRQTLKASSEFSAQSLHCDGECTGICEPGLPELAMSVKDRVAHLKRLHALAKECSGDADFYRERTRECYRVLRAAWERLVEEVLLAGTVVRYGHGVQTQLLAEVQVEDEDYERVFNAMELCSERFEGHDRGADRGDAVCMPDEILGDIQDLESFRKELERRKQAIGSRRRARTKVVAPS
jgi:energy-coupling factor transporter ATP-binding protein EcfA2